MFASLLSLTIIPPISYNISKKFLQGGIFMKSTTNYISEVTAVSSKGQVVLPKSIRDRLGITPGVKLMVFSDDTNILLKPIPEPDLSEFNSLMDAAASWASSVGMTEDDIMSAIKSVRATRKEMP